MIISSRTTRRGRLVPAFQIDDEFAGLVAGNLWHSASGYMQTNINGKKVLLHRMLWAARHGAAPAELDHINRDVLDNRLCNLRPATRSLNVRNTRRRPGKLGFRGVSANRGCKTLPFKARVKVKGEERIIGYFATAEEASAAYESERRRLLSGNRDG
jgi:hypothetical protein